MSKKITSFGSKFKMKKFFDLKKVSICLSLAAFNLILGSIVAFLKLPIYLDSIGIVISSVLLGWQYGILSAIFTVTAGFFLINPYLPFYVLTSFGIVATSKLARKLNLFSTPLKTILAGLMFSISSALLSAPVTAYLFKGSTLSGSDAITTYFVSTGRNILNSVILSGLSSEPVDKILVAVLCYYIFQSIPTSFVIQNSFLSYKNDL